jgi:mannan endo-1,6-alpha-mannosidase
MVDYHAYTSDSSYLPATISGLLSQSGPNDDYIVPAHTYDEGNDDQAFWGLALLSAAEHQLFRDSFPPSPAEVPSWLQLATNLFSNQISRWDNTSCGGGMKWQIYPANTYGYDYKNSIANACAFTMAARLATLVSTPEKPYYVDWARHIWDWSTQTGLLNTRSAPWEIYDGLGDDRQNCTGPIQTTRWSYNVAVYLAGAAAMYNVTGSSAWLNAVYRLLEATLAFTASATPFKNVSGTLLVETACEPHDTCNVDQFSFKGYTARTFAKILSTWLVQDPAHSVAKAFIGQILIPSAAGAARSCSGGNDGKQCGNKWYLERWDGTLGAGQEMAALEMIQSLLTLTE